MQLDSRRTVDPRDNLDKARRRELVEFANANGLTDVTEMMPADGDGGIRQLLRSKGLTRIPVPRRDLGAQASERTFPMRGAPTKKIEVSDDQLKEFQKFLAWKAQQGKPVAPKPDKPVAEMSFNELRQECKRRSIKFGRKDNLKTLRAMLEQNAT